MQVCRSIFTMAQGGGENGKEGGKRKWYENVSSALFIDPVEDPGRWLGHHRQPAHTGLYLRECSLT